MVCFSQNCWCHGTVFITFNLLFTGLKSLHKVEVQNSNSDCLSLRLCFMWVKAQCTSPANFGLLCKKEPKPQGPEGKEERASLILWPIGANWFLSFMFLLLVCVFFSLNPWLLTAKWINSLGSRILKQEFSCLPEHLIYLIYWSSESGSCVFQMWSCRSTFLSIQRTRSCLKLLEQLMKSQSSFKAIHPTSRGANEAFLGNWICSSVLSHQQPPSLPEIWACVTCPADNFHKMLIFNRTCRNLVSVGPLISVVFGWNCPLSSSVRVEGSWEADEQRQGDSYRIPFLWGTAHK